MNVLELGDERYDSAKSSLCLYYLARAANRVAQRDIAKRKVELSIKQLKKISTKDLHKHVDELEGHIAEALHREKQIQGHQEGEEHVHKELTHKITKLEHKLGRYLDTQEERKERMVEIENKIKQKFESKREKMKVLHSDLERLMKLYKLARKSKKHTTADLLPLARRIAAFKQKMAFLK